MNFSKSFNINYEEEGLTFEEQMLNSYILKKDLVIAKENLFIVSKELDNFIEEFTEEYYRFNASGRADRLKTYKLSINKYENLVILENDNFFIYIVKDFSKKSPKDNLNIYTKDFYNLEFFLNIFKKYAIEWDSEVKTLFTKYSFTNGQIITDKNYKYLKNYEDIKKEYYPFINIDLFLKEFIESDENILILTGQPGVGKSKFPLLLIKEILKNPEYIDKFNKDNDDLLEDEKNLNVGYAKNIQMLSTDLFWNKIGYENILIFDDLDFILSDRSENREDELKNQFLSHLLSFTDGIEKNKVKIIITTNQDYKDIDSALLRKGRLFDILKFRGLTKEEALEVWENNRLDENLFSKNIKDIIKNDMILQSDLANLIQNIKRNKEVIKKEDYILDNNIRITPEKSHKKVGLI